MNLAHLMYIKMVNSGMYIKPGTLDSLKEAVENNNVYFFKNAFVTWFVDGDALEINNLCTTDSGEPLKLYKLRDFLLKKKYPNIKCVRWWDDKKKKPFEVTFRR